MSQGRKSVKKIEKYVFLGCSLLFAVVGAFASEIKEPNVAGAFYSSDSSGLKKEVSGYLVSAKKVKVRGKPVVLISPHAGYVYSGPVAAQGYAAIAGMKFDTVIILAASHYFPFKGISVYKDGYFGTPIGALEVDSALASMLVREDPVMLFSKPQVFDREHSVEVQLPFLQEALDPGFKILPVLFGELNYEECVNFANYLSRVTRGKNVLVVVSTDLSHYKPYSEANAYDGRTIDLIKNFDSRGLWDAVSRTGWNVCGVRPLVAGIEFAILERAKDIDVIEYANSGDTAGEKDRVVGYLSALITKRTPCSIGSAGVQPTVEEVLKKEEAGMLTKSEQKRLLEIARKTIEASAEDRPLPVFKEYSAGLLSHRGVFVTLQMKGRLRGCIGTFTSDEALYKTVAKMAVASSTQDYRFSPVKMDELKDITIEISVLTESTEVSSWRDVRLGQDGVIIRKGYSSGVFLPQVATETGWDLETFLSELCAQKAGLRWDCYKDPSTKIYTFQAYIFNEKEK